MSPEEIVCLLETTTPDLTARLARCSKDYEHNDGRMSGKFLYLTFRDSKATVQELIEVAYMRMANFALPKSRTEEAAQKFAANPNLADPLVQLVTEARDLFMKTKTETGRSGELGELILYMLVEWLHKAPIVACKMYVSQDLSSNADSWCRWGAYRI